MKNKYGIILGMVALLIFVGTACEKNPVDAHSETFTVSLEIEQGGSIVTTPALNVESVLAFKVLEGDDDHGELVTGLSPTVEMEMVGGTSGHMAMDVHAEDHEAGHYEVHKTFTETGTYEFHFEFDHDGTVVEEKFEIVI